MDDLDQESNMSLNFIGDISAEGFNNVGVSNFVNDCYAQNVTLTLRSSVVNAVADYKYRTITTNLDNSVITDTWDANNSTQEVGAGDLSDNNFPQDKNGTLSMRLHYNYEHDVTQAINPQRITLDGLGVGCAIPANCQMNANLSSTYENNQTREINAPLNHYYGRTNAPRQRFVSPVGTLSSPATDFIYYEAYCNLTTGCNKALLPTPTRYLDDSRWYVNSAHATADGLAGVVTQKTTGLIKVTGTTVTAAANGQSITSLVYDGSKGYPYKTTMRNFPSSWLIYNRYNAGATFNEFEVEFDKGDSDWAGAKDTDTTTGSNAAVKTNRRSMW